ncbi:hypothetical protein ISCGN_024455 [Ixodes scapularis]
MSDINPIHNVLSDGGGARKPRKSPHPNSLKAGDLVADSFEVLARSWLMSASVPMEDRPGNDGLATLTEAGGQQAAEEQLQITAAPLPQTRENHEIESSNALEINPTLRKTTESVELPDKLPESQAGPAETSKSATSFKCNPCTRVFRSKASFAAHMQKHDSEKSYECRFCLQLFPTQDLWANHVSIHKDKKRYECRLCCETFSSKPQLVRHGRTHSKDRPFPCLECPSVFGDLLSLRVHQRCHAVAKPYKCQHCEAAFTARQNLDAHLRFHRAGMVYTCGKCGLTFSDWTSFAVHERSHATHVTETFACERCGRKYFHKTRLLRHLQSHEDKKPS